MAGPIIIFSTTSSIEGKVEPLRQTRGVQVHTGIGRRKKVRPLYEAHLDRNDREKTRIEAFARGTYREMYGRTKKPAGCTTAAEYTIMRPSSEAFGVIMEKCDTIGGIAGPCQTYQAVCSTAGWQ